MCAGCGVLPATRPTTTINMATNEMKNDLKIDLWLTCIFAALLSIGTMLCVPADFTTGLRLASKYFIGMAIFFTTVSSFPRIWAVTITTIVTVILTLCLPPSLFQGWRGLVVPWYPAGSSLLLAWYSAGIVVSYVRSTYARRLWVTGIWLVLCLIWVSTEVVFRCSRSSLASADTVNSGAHAALCAAVVV